MTNNAEPKTHNTLHITDINWTIAGNGFAPYINLFDESDSSTKKIILSEPTYNFSWKLSEKRYCIGPGIPSPLIPLSSSGKGTGPSVDRSNPCKFNNVLDSDVRPRCGFCEKENGFMDAFIFGGKPNPQIEEYLKNKHFVYLAYFQPGILKVGTASEKRSSLRLIEQDALIFTFIGESTGFEIQKLEKYISKNFGITEFVNSSNKLKYISQQPRLEKAIEVIKSNYQRIYDKLLDSEFSSWLYKPSELKFIDIAENTSLLFPEEVTKLRIERLKFSISGRFAGLRGNYLLINNSDNIIAIDKREIIGRFIESYLDEDMNYSSFKQPKAPSLFD